jgi:hypothetical protein
VRIHEVQDLEQMPRDGLMLTSPVRTFIDLAACTDLTDLVSAGDSLVRRTGTGPELFRNAAAARTGARGIRLAREAAELIRTGVDSPMETRLRLLLLLAGLPEPQVGRVVCEGWLVRVITAGDLFRSPAVVIGRILEDLHSRGHPAAPATPDLSRLDRFAA